MIYWLGEIFIVLFIVFVISLIVAYVWAMHVKDEIDYQEWRKSND